MQFVSQSRVNVIEIAFFLGRSPQSMSIHDVHMYPRAACVHFGDLLKASKSQLLSSLLATNIFAEYSINFGAGYTTHNKCTITMTNSRGLTLLQRKGWSL
mmetsp:Transcript_85659/g.143030  ORF Transcript_85659/g.143030 Transcript_85659/m.143030 type:complete len:100 (-) Transcript_85659:154-453(-)